MQPTPATRKHTGPTLPDLSPDARAALALPLYTEDSGIFDDDGSRLCTILTGQGSNVADCEIAAFIAALVNEALTPNAPPADPNVPWDCGKRDTCEADCPWAYACTPAPVTLVPETTTELSQLITTEFEATEGQR